MAHPRLDHALNKGFHWHEAINSNASFSLDKMIFHRKVTQCDRKRNTISVIRKSPWTFGGYIDIHSEWHAPRQSQPIQNSRVKQRLLNPPVNHWIEALSHLRHYFRFLVELWPAWTKLRTRGNSISFPPRPLLASSFRHVCHVIEQGLSSYGAIHTIFIFAKVHLAFPIGLKCFYIS